MSRQGGLGRLLFGTGVWAALVIVLSIPIGALLFPDGWSRVRERVDRLLVERPLPIPEADESAKPVAQETEVDAGARTEVRQPENTASPGGMRDATSEDLRAGETSAPAAVPAGEDVEPPRETDQPNAGPEGRAAVMPPETAAAPAADRVGPEPPESPWAEVIAKGAELPPVDPDRVARALTEDEAQQVRLSYRRALDNLREARKRPASGPQ